MSYPNKIPRSRNRRAFGRGQSIGAAPVTVVVTAAGSIATLTFSRPVNIAGTVPLVVATRTFVSQAITSPTVMTITMSGALTTLAWSLPTPIGNVSTYEGGVALGAAGTFP